MVLPQKLAAFRANQQPQVKPKPKPQPAPSLAKKAATILTASAKWIAAGRPVRESEEVARIFSICAACPHFKPTDDPKAGHCGLCGCGCRAEGNVLNKTAWATEACPDTPARW